MKHKIVKETKPTLKTFGKYKAKAAHFLKFCSRIIISSIFLIIFAGEK